MNTKVSGGGGGAVLMESEISELTQHEVLEAEIYESSVSSDDKEFTTKLILPQEKQAMHSRMKNDLKNDIVDESLLKTPTKVKPKVINRCF